MTPLVEALCCPRSRIEREGHDSSVWVGAHSPLPNSAHNAYEAVYSCRPWPRSLDRLSVLRVPFVLLEYLDQGDFGAAARGK